MIEPTCNNAIDSDVTCLFTKDVSKDFIDLWILPIVKSLLSKDWIETHNPVGV